MSFWFIKKNRGEYSYFLESNRTENFHIVLQHVPKEKEPKKNMSTNDESVTHRAFSQLNSYDHFHFQPSFVSSIPKIKFIPFFSNLLVKAKNFEKKIYFVNQTFLSFLCV